MVGYKLLTDLSTCRATRQDLFSDASFAKIKPGSRVINVARGGVISEVALARALDGGRVAGAALDVFADEPPAFEGGRDGRAAGQGASDGPHL